MDKSDKIREIPCNGGFNRRKKEALYKIKRLSKSTFIWLDILLHMVRTSQRYFIFPSHWIPVGQIVQIISEITTPVAWRENLSVKIQENRRRCTYRIWVSYATVSLWIFILFLLTGCEIYSDALTKPEYQPSLAMHAILSPQEGGQVYIKYTEPVDTIGAQPVPPLPEVSVLLYEKGNEKYVFKELKGGHFSLDTAGLELWSDRDYHIEVQDKLGNAILKSGIERLPSLPDVTATRFYQDTTTFPEKNYIDVGLKLTPDSETAYHFRKDYSIDSGRIFIQGRDPQYGRFSIRQLVHSADYPDGVIEETLTASVFVRPEPGSDKQYVNAVKLWVDHFSPGLTLFLQDVADANEAYGDPFNTQSPVYSNIEGGYGIFGMYNSWVGVVHLE